MDAILSNISFKILEFLFCFKFIIRFLINLSPNGSSIIRDYWLDLYLILPCKMVLFVFISWNSFIKKNFPSSTLHVIDSSSKLLLYPEYSKQRAKNSQDNSWRIKTLSHWKNQDSLEKCLIPGLGQKYERWVRDILSSCVCVCVCVWMLTSNEAIKDYEGWVKKTQGPTWRSSYWPKIGQFKHQ